LRPLRGLHSLGSTRFSPCRSFRPAERYATRGSARSIVADIP
jgi:hypothetical protein